MDKIFCNLTRNKCIKFLIKVCLLCIIPYLYIKYRFDKPFSVVLLYLVQPMMRKNSLLLIKINKNISVQ